MLSDTHTHTHDLRKQIGAAVFLPQTRAAPMWLKLVSDCPHGLILQVPVLEWTQTH